MVQVTEVQLIIGPKTQDALLDMLHEARESGDIGQAVLTKFEAALHTLGIEYEPEL